jgi:thiol-disulfide isomerase/thioredoxin
MQKLLSETAKNYREAKSVRIERTAVSTIDSELMKLSDKSFSTLILAPGRRYRREDKAARFWTIQISNGAKRWDWYPWRRQYVEEALHNADTEEVSAAEGGWFGWLKQIDSKLAAGRVQRPQTIEIDGRKVDCMVIIGPPAPNQRPDPAMSVQTTYWIDRARKVLVKEEFAMHSPVPENKYVQTTTTIYQLTELSASLPESLFEFAPPSGTQQIDRLELEPVALLGKPAPALRLHAVDGNTFDLISLRGKAVIVDFWATWCQPCREAMPALVELYAELKGKNISVVSVSLDEDPEDARRYVSKYKFPWISLVDPQRESDQTWGTSGIPKLVLVDSTGTVIFESDGYDEQQEAKLRAALHQIDPTVPAKKPRN